ncbi:MAG TPA: hypothetical protein VFS55_08355 [Dokdonella sp.]|nr:hypothetical protein [Dokdonella sp.]
MTPFLRTIPAIALALAIAVSAHATSSLSFEGGGYWIDLEVGETARPVIASVRFHAPDDRDGVVLARDLVTVESFDTARRVLVLRHAAGNDGVEPFTLSVEADAAVLDIDGRRVTAAFDWSM